MSAASRPIPLISRSSGGMGGGRATSRSSELPACLHGSDFGRREKLAVVPGVRRIIHLGERPARAPDAGGCLLKGAPVAVLRPQHAPK